MLKKKGKRKNKLVNWIKLLKMIRERWLGDKKLNFAKIICFLQQMNLAASSLGIQWVLRFSPIVQSIFPIITLVKITLKKLNLKKKKGKRQNLLVNMLSKKKLKMIRERKKIKNNRLGEQKKLRKPRKKEKRNKLGLLS